MSSEWPIIELGNLVSVKGGKRLPKGSALQQSANNHPYIRIRDMGQRYLPSEGLEYVPDEVFPHIKRYIVEENDLLISIVGTVGLVCLIDERFHLASQTENAAKLTGLDSSDAQYLYYYLTSGVGQEEIKSRTVGAVQPKLPLYNIEKIPVVWPDECIRKEIVSQLSSLDDKIQLNRQINQTLEQMAQAIFQSWFVDFEPVKAKIAAREDWLARQAAQSDAHDDAPQFSSPVCYAHEFANAAAPAPATQADLETFMNRAAMCAISGKTDADLDAMPAADYQRLYHTASLFPDELVESELGEIPKGWEVGVISDLFELHRGFDLPQSQRTDGPYKVFAAGGVHGNHSEYKLEPPGVITGRSGVIGNVYLSLDKYWPLNTTLYVRDFRKCGPYYAFHLLSILDLGAFNSGSAVPSLNRNFVHASKTIIPNSEILGEFEGMVEILFSTMKVNEEESFNLIDIRDSLLPKLLYGELDISVLTDLAAITDTATGAAHV